MNSSDGPNHLFAQGFAPPIQTANLRANPLAVKNEEIVRDCEPALSPLLSDPTPSTNFEAGVGKQLTTLVGQAHRTTQTVEGVRPKQRRLVELTPRDRGILALCFEQQFLLMEHVRHFFPGVSKRRVEIRIAELIQTGFLKREFHPEIGQKAVLRLTPRGIHAALSAGARHLKLLNRLNPKTLSHDAIVTSCRLRLLTFWNAAFVSERAIKAKDFPEIPDGLFFFPSGNGVALEVENSDKGRTRFLQLLERWSSVPSVSLVLYVATHPDLYRLLKRFLSEGPKDQPFGLVLWEELRSGTPLVWTSRGEIDLLGRKEI